MVAVVTGVFFGVRNLYVSDPRKVFVGVAKRTHTHTHLCILLSADLFVDTFACDACVQST